MKNLSNFSNFINNNMNSKEKTKFADNLPHSNMRKVFPTVEECRIKNMVKCTQEGCSSVFTSESNLVLHVTKHHKRSNLPEASIKQYHCPDLTCVYNNTRYFKSMKFLRQHYLKIHTEKQFICFKCQKGFSSQNILNNHIDYCGIDFICCDCKESYTCYETLKTHGRRKKHKILTKPEYKANLNASASNITISQNFTTILPKTLSLIILPSNDKTVCNQESQTVVNEPCLRNKLTQVGSDNAVNHMSRQTQTGNKNNHFSVETQTVGDFISANRKNMDILLDSLNQKNSKTQTDVVESRNTSCNTSFNLNDFDFTDVEMNSSSTQTLYTAPISTRSYDSIHTDTSDLLVGNSLNSPLNNFEFDNNHMETQTDFLFEDEMFNCDYYSNTCTQTCDDILNEFGLNDIQTQTVFDDMLRSVESQTMMSHVSKMGMNCKDTSHMETQTDAEFRQMLEVINS